jgi:hypothetical protein
MQYSPSIFVQLCSSSSPHRESCGNRESRFTGSQLDECLSHLAWQGRPPNAAERHFRHQQPRLRDSKPVKVRAGGSLQANVLSNPLPAFPPLRSPSPGLLLCSRYSAPFAPDCLRRRTAPCSESAIMPAIDGERLVTFEEGEEESEYGYVRKVWSPICQSPLPRGIFIRGYISWLWNLVRYTVF